MSGVGICMMGATGGGGGSAVTITLANQDIYAYNAGGASSSFQLNSTGVQYYSLNGGAAVSLGDWCTPHSQAPNYECYATLVTGTLTSGTVGSWLPLSSSQIWTRNCTAGIYKTCTVNIGIRRVGDVSIIASADIMLEADAS